MPASPPPGADAARAKHVDPSPRPPSPTHPVSAAAKKPPVEIAFSNGKTVNAVAGQSLADVARTAGAKIRYDCKNGDCGTCTVKLNGRAVRACVAKVPAGGPFKVQVGDVAGSAAESKTKSLQDQLKAENSAKKKGLFG